MYARIALLSLALGLVACGSSEVEPFLGTFDGNVTFSYTPEGGATTTHVFTDTSCNGVDLTQDEDDSADVELDVLGDADCHLSGPVDDGVLSFRSINCNVQLDQSYYSTMNSVGTASIAGDTLTFEHTGEFRVDTGGSTTLGTYVYSFTGDFVPGSR